MLDEPRCAQRLCKHFGGAGQPHNPEARRAELEAGERWVCPAFPGGIPADIAFGENLHLEFDPRQAPTAPDIVYESRAG